MMDFLIRFQVGFTKFPCYLYLWDSRNTSLHYKQKKWSPRCSNYILGHSVKQKSLMEPKKVLVLPLHIKLGLIKQFVKSFNPEDDTFKHIQELFLKLSEAKVKIGIFWGPKVNILMNWTLSTFEQRAGKRFFLC